MAKPAAVQKLRHGKALCGKTFGGFVDTFNWLVDFCLSLKGDGDANNSNGVISVDRSDPSAPVIRASPARENGSGGGGGSSGGDEEDPLEPGADPEEPYEDPEEEDGEDAIDADGNEISGDAGSIDDDNGDYCNSILDGGGDPTPPAGNAISYTCSK